MLEGFIFPFVGLNFALHIFFSFSVVDYSVTGKVIRKSSKSIFMLPWIWGESVNYMPCEYATYATLFDRYKVYSLQDPGVSFMFGKANTVDWFARILNAKPLLIFFI